MKRAEMRRQLATHGVVLPLSRMERLQRRWSKLRARWSWFICTPERALPGDTLTTLRVRMHIRKWHPGWWLFVGRAYWHALRGTRLSLYIRGRKVLPHG